LTIQGNIWQPVDAKPRIASFGRITEDDAKTQTLVRKLTVINNMNTPANITDVKSTNPSFQAEIKTLEEGKQYELIVTLVPPLRSGSTNGSIEMSTGVPESPKLTIPVRAYVTSEVEVLPSKLTIRTGRVGNLKRYLTVRNNSKKPIKISDVQASSPALKLTLEEPKPGMQYKIGVDIPAEYEVPSGGDHITFKTDSPKTPSFTIPIIAGKYRGASPQHRAGINRGKSTPKRTPAQKEAAERAAEEAAGQKAAKESAQKHTGTQTKAVGKTHTHGR
jgi:hypothetical protein